MTGASPMLQAAKLWEKVSGKGNTYLVGRLGGVRILILRNRDAGTEGEPDWHLFFADGTPRGASDAAAAAPRRRSAYPAQQPDSATDPRPFDDEIPL